MKILKIKKSIILYCIFLLIMLIVITGKRNLHVDEVASYILSNNNESISLDFEEGKTYTSIRQLYLESVAVNSVAEQFNFINVWGNQAKDVHPPLYYVILHIICSLNLGRFSIWYAASINICFAMFTLYIVRKLMNLFIDDLAIINLCSILYITSAGILQNVSFLRMYVMAMFWVTLTAYLFIKVYDEKFSWKRWIQIGLTAIAGALTHYYCIIYLCATCIVFGVCLIFQRRYKEIVCLLVDMITAAVISIGIFPSMLRHMFAGYRGAESFYNILFGTWNDYWERIKNFYKFLNTQMLGGVGGGGMVFALLIILLFVVLKKEYDFLANSLNKTHIMKWLIIGIPIAIYFCFVSISAVYVTDRYLFPIYSVTFVLFLCILHAIWRGLVSVKYEYIVMCLIGTVFIIHGLGNAQWDYLYKSSVELLSRAQIYSERNCISVYDIAWKEQSTFYEMENYKSVTFIDREHLNLIQQCKDLAEDGFILNILGGDDDRIITTIKQYYPYMNKCEKLGEYTYSTTYFICEDTNIDDGVNNPSELTNFMSESKDSIYGQLERLGSLGQWIKSIFDHE